MSFIFLKIERNFFFVENKIGKHKRCQSFYFFGNSNSLTYDKNRKRLNRRSSLVHACTSYISQVHV